MGIEADSDRTSSTEIPAWPGVQGPGEITTACGAIRSMSATETASLRTTSVAQPNSRK